ncbi:MAG: hypothetical protein ACD_29C00032G0003 [uncultured bacterium]|nr:MAG: hypothetical protein ACD_29C00032G0003 [uncultured bacterium]
MVIVYVKHFLNSEGLKYFNDAWFPDAVYKEISRQPGFIAATKSIDEKNGCGHVTVKFQDEETLTAWIKKPEHDVVDLLDPYRTQAYWKAARTSDEKIDQNSTALTWKQIEAKTPPASSCTYGT